MSSLCVTEVFPLEEWGIVAKAEAPVVVSSPLQESEAFITAAYLAYLFFSFFFFK